jgi:hypothetical protein
MTYDRFETFFVAPEIIALQLAHDALCAIESALLVEHPLLTGPPSPDDPPIRRRARDILRHLPRLRRALRRYRRAVRAIVREARSDDLPF